MPRYVEEEMQVEQTEVQPGKSRRSQEGWCHGGKRVGFREGGVSSVTHF